MDLLRQPLKMKNLTKDSQSVLYLTNTLLFTIFFSLSYFLLLRWREKIRTSTPLHFLTIFDIAAIFCLIVSVIYLMSLLVGTVGGGTQLASQSACLNLLGVKGASKEAPAANSRQLATIVAASVLALAHVCNCCWASC